MPRGNGINYPIYVCNPECRPSDCPGNDAYGSISDPPKCSSNDVGVGNIDADDGTWPGNVVKIVGYEWAAPNGTVEDNYPGTCYETKSRGPSDGSFYPGNGTYADVVLCRIDAD